MIVNVSFVNLTHTGQLVAVATLPLGIASVVAYVKNVLGDQIDIEIFKYPKEFSNYLDATTPKIATFWHFLGICQ